MGVNARRPGHVGAHTAMTPPPRSAAARRTLTAAAVTLALVAARPARADTPGDRDAWPALAWGLTTAELGTAGVAYLAFATRVPVGEGAGLAINFTPIVLGAGAATVAGLAELSPRPAFAVHGAGWAGLDLFLLGGLVDGRHERDGFRAGRTAWLLGALGAGAGGVLGASQIDGDDARATWMAAPVGGFAAGGLVLGGVLALAARDSDKAPGRFALGATIGLSAGLAAATVVAFTTDDASAAPRLAGRPLRAPIMLRLGGSF